MYIKLYEWLINAKEGDKWCIKSKIKDIELNEYFLFKVNKNFNATFMTFEVDEYYVGYFYYSTDVNSILFCVFDIYHLYLKRLSSILKNIELSMNISNWELERLKKNMIIYDKSKHRTEIVKMVKDLKEIENYNL